MENIERDISAIKEKLNQMMPVVAQTRVEVEQINNFITGNPKFKQKGIAERMETVEKYRWYIIAAVFLGGSGGAIGIIKQFL